MKKLIFFFLIFAFVSCNRIPEENRVLVKEASDSVLVVSVPKARCVNCQEVIEGGLQNEKGVKQSILNLHTKELSIVYAPDVTSPEALKESVKTLKGQIPCK